MLFIHRGFQLRCAKMPTVAPGHFIAIFRQSFADKVGRAVSHPRKPRDDAVEIGSHVLVDLKIPSLIGLRSCHIF